MSKRNGSPVWALFFIFAGGCSTTGRGYFADRWRDFSQILSADVGMSTGIQLHAGVSHLVQAGWGSYDGSRAGLRNGRAGSWREERSEFGLGPVYLHEVDWEDASERLVGHHHARFHEEGFVEYPWEWGVVETDRDPGDLGVGANAGFVGFSLSFKSLEFCDFLAGLFGWDPLGDDLGAKEEAQLLEDLKSLDPKIRLRAARNLALLAGRTGGYLSYSNPNVITKEQMRAAAELEEK